MNASAAGKWIFYNKAAKSIQERAALLKQILAHTTPANLPGLPALAMKAEIPASRVVPFFRRFTKGLLYLLYPD